mgnify:CR=1 FL=1
MTLLRLVSAVSLFSVSILIPTLSFAGESGVSGYLPLNQNPLLESHVNRIMIAAELGAVKRPYPINTIKLAVAKVCQQDQRRQPAIQKGCYVVNKYLKQTNKTLYINHASLDLKAQKQSDLYLSQPETTLKNQRGERLDSGWSIQAQGVFNVNNYVMFSGGAKAWSDETNLEDTYVSIGLPQAQLDIGYKPHWLSPFKQSAMLLSTHAPTFANISLSNNTPLTSWNINYELFAGELSTTNKISYGGKLTSGKPLLTGLHLSASPFDGFTLAINRIFQSGGDERGTPSLKEIFDAFIDPSGADNIGDDLSRDEQFGNQAASIVSRFDFIGSVPFSVYFEYAGEDTSRGTNYRLGNSSLSAGVDLPIVFDTLSINYEYSQWQNAWYAHSVYADGLQNQGNLIGHFAAEQRLRTTSIAGDAIGSTHHNITIGWQLAPQDRLVFNYNQTKNEPFSSFEYVTGRQLELTWYSHIDDYPATLTLFGGENTLAEEHAGLTFSVAW